MKNAYRGTLSPLKKKCSGGMQISVTGKPWKYMLKMLHSGRTKRTPMKLSTANPHNFPVSL